MFFFGRFAMRFEDCVRCGVKWSHFAGYAASAAMVGGHTRNVVLAGKLRNVFTLVG